MQKIIKLAGREYKAAVKTKGFIIGLVLAPIIMSGSLLTFILLKDNVDTTDKHAIIIDRTGLIAPALIEAAEQRNENEIFDRESGKKVKPAYFFRTVEPDNSDPQQQRFELSNQIRQGKLSAFLDIGSEVLHPGEDSDARRIAYYAQNPAMDELRRWLSWPINRQLRKQRLADAGVAEAEVKDLFTWIGVEGLRLVSLDELTGDISQAKQASEIEAAIVPIVIMMLLLLMMMMSVPGMLNSVMEEKTQRIAEVLLAAVKPFEFMMGKVLGGIAVSLTTSLVYIVGGILFVKHMGFEEYVPFHILPWFFAFMLLAIVMFGAFSAALGSTCSEAKDAQSLTFPTILPVLIPMFVYLPVVKEPMSNFSTVMSLIPPFTPLLMVLRMATPAAVPLWQPIIGLIGVILCTLLFVWAGGRIFRVAILIQGTPPKLANMLRWAIRG